MDILLFSNRLVDTFKLHGQLDVQVQKLTAGAARKVCGMRDGVLKVDGVAANKVLLCLSAVCCAERPGKFTCPAPR